jgi:hypothetical protein
MDLHDFGRNEGQSPFFRFRNEWFLGQQDRQSLPNQNDRYTVHEWNIPRLVFVIEYMGRLPIPNLGEFVAILTATRSRLPLSNHRNGNQPRLGLEAATFAVRQAALGVTRGGKSLD